MKIEKIAWDVDRGWGCRADWFGGVRGRKSRRRYAIWWAAFSRVSYTRVARVYGLYE